MSEATDQMALIEFCERFSGRVPELARVVHVPNGEKRDKATAGKLKAMGVRRGVPDLLLPVARTPFHGLWVELKTTKGKLSADQVEWLTYLNEAGYLAYVAYQWTDAAAFILDYLGCDPKEYGL